MSRFFRAAQRPVTALFAVAFIIASSSSTSVLAVVPLDDGGPKPVSIERPGPEVLEYSPEPVRPPQPLMSAQLLPLPAQSPAPVPPASELDPAADGTTRSNYPWGAGTASWYGPGSGVAMHYCSWRYRTTHGCGSVRITSTDTGRSVVAPVIDYCQCYWGTPQQRIVDLQTGLLAPLGLSSAAGLYSVVVEPVD